MDESACLVRSFSNPADISHEAKEGDPIRALTESISFGRFMSESLAWEKWSTFSHNRYLEEVEKFSKPGSVAQKKAFFEAHYKRRAAMRAAALLEQANVVTNDASQMGTINEASIDPSLNADLANLNASLTVNQQEKDVSDVEIANSADIDAGNLNVETENMDVTDVERGQAVMEDVNVEKYQQVENSKALENVDVHGMIMIIPKIPLKECAGQRSSTSSGKKRRTNSSSKSSVPSSASKLPLYPSKRVASAQARSDAGVAKSNGNSNEKKKTIPNSLHMSINFAYGASKTNKISPRIPRDSSTPLQTPIRALKEAADQENLAPSSEKRQSNSTSKLSNHCGVSKQATSRIGNNHALINKNPALDPNEQRRIVQKSLHMSMNFTPRAGETNTNPLQTPTRALKEAADQENLAPSSEKRQSNSTSKLSNHCGVSKQATSRIGNNRALINKKPALDPNEQRRIVQKSLHMSMNFTPRAGETNKTSSKISRESSTALQTPTRASFNGGSKHASKVLQSQDKRTIAVRNRSVTGAVRGDGRWPSLSNCSKSSSASGTSAKSRICSSPFSFRSEERAAKRREFFKKLEDKRNSKEAEKSQMLIQSKEKAKNDLNKLRQSTDLKARPNEDLYHGSQSSHNHAKKITSSLPQSPKFGRKPSPSRVQDADSRPPRRPSINTESSKSGLMKNNRITCSGTSLPKNRHENASPNIQQK